MIKVLLVLIVLFPVALNAQVSHTITWEKGAHKKTVSNWVSAINATSKIGSTSYILKKSGGLDRYHATGHRDVIVWVPSTTDLSKPYLVLVWLHGNRGFIKSRTFIERTLQQVIPEAVAGYNFVLVLPEMPWTSNGRTPTGSDRRVWREQNAFVKFIGQISGVLYRHDPNASGEAEYRIVGHSAGGSAIRSLSLSGDLCRINVSMVVWSDSTYGSWFGSAWSGCLGQQTDIVNKVFVAKYGGPWRSIRAFLKKCNCADLVMLKVLSYPPWRHKTIGNNIVDLSGILR